MNKLYAAMIAAAAFAGAAHAQEASWDPLASYTPGTLQRSEVQAQASAALKAGEIEFGEASLFAKSPSSGVLTRDHVQAEAREARRLGVLQGGEVTMLPSAEQNAAINAAGVRADDARMAAR